MRWDGGDNGGFTTGEPWLPIGHDIEHRNVAHQLAYRMHSDARSRASGYVIPSNSLCPAMASIAIRAQE